MNANVKHYSCSTKVIYDSYINGHYIVINEINHELFKDPEYFVQDIIRTPEGTVDEHGDIMFVTDLEVLRTSRAYKTFQEAFKEFSALSSFYVHPVSSIDTNIDNTNLPLHGGELADAYFNSIINSIVSISNIKIIEQISEEAFDPYDAEIRYDFDMTIKDTKFNCHAIIRTGSYSSRQDAPEITVTIDDPNTVNPNAGAYADFNFSVGVDVDYIGVEYSHIMSMNYADSLKHIDNNMLDIESTFMVPIKAIGAKAMREILNTFLHMTQENND